MIKKTINENWILINTDRDLQLFMVGAFGLLFSILAYCTICDDFGQAEVFFQWTDEILSGTFSWEGLETTLSPLTMLLLLPPRLITFTPETYRYVFSLYGFAFYMLGGHYMLKCCRETGFSQRDAYVLLFVTFVCAFSFMTLSTGPFATAFVIISLWLFHRKEYILTFIPLALASAIAIWPLLLAIIYLILLAKESNLSDVRGNLTNAVYGLLVFAVLYAVLFCTAYLCLNGFPSIHLPCRFQYASYLGSFLYLTGLPAPPIATGLVLAIIVSIGAALSLRKTDWCMSVVARILETALIMALVFRPIHDGTELIWIAMLLPMTQMCEKPSKYRKPVYVSFVLFAVLSLACDSVLPTDDAWFDCVSIIRLIALIALGLSVFADFRETAKNRNEK